MDEARQELECLIDMLHEWVVKNGLDDMTITVIKNHGMSNTLIEEFDMFKIYGEESSNET